MAAYDKIQVSLKPELSAEVRAEAAAARMALNAYIVQIIKARVKA